MASNWEDGNASRHEQGDTTPDATELAGLSETFSILSHRQNRRILFHLLQRDEPISVDALTAQVASDSTSLATDGTVGTEGHNGGVSR